MGHALWNCHSKAVSAAILVGGHTCRRALFWDMLVFTSCWKDVVTCTEVHQLQDGSKNAGTDSIRNETLIGTAESQGILCRKAAIS